MKDINWEEDWEDVEDVWCIKRHLFPGLSSICKKNLTLEEAKKLSKKWNRLADAYESYSYEKQ